MKLFLAILSIGLYGITNAQYTQLYDFTGNGSFIGAYPRIDQNLITADGALYGMTSQGGTNGMGTLFKILPDGTGYSKLLDFAGTSNGQSPSGSLISDGTFLYGMTTNGGINNMGVIFKIKFDGTGYSKLHDFGDTLDGRYPQGSLISDGAFLYGMTYSGGNSTCITGGCGTIFKILPDGTNYSKLFDFGGTSNGKNPSGSLISDGTFLYGMTTNGGINNMGTLFKIMSDGTNYSKLYDFGDTLDGRYPQGSLISDGTFLYGMTLHGGTNNIGVIFKIKFDGTGYSKLIDFASVANGSEPFGSLVSDGTFLYGMTSSGGTNGYGTLFKIMHDGTSYYKLLDFAGITNGQNPSGSLISDGTFLYGMTTNGGISNMGTLFKIMSDGTNYSKLLDFAHDLNGRAPSGSLISDGTFLYGMTTEGGINSMGVIFKIKFDGTGYSKLFDFAGTSNGQNPYGSLFYDGTFLYGMTSYGINQKGTLFKIKPDGTNFSKLHDFGNTLDGSNPQGSLFYDGTFLYGTTLQGGINSQGTIFKIMPDGTNYSKLFDFGNASNASFPHGDLISDGTFLYGMAYGGTGIYGVVFKIKPDGTNFSCITNFSGTNGMYPKGTLIYDGISLYGMTSSGGTNGYGTIFKIKTDGTDYFKLYDFGGGLDGNNPHGSLISDGKFFYGLTNAGGTNGKGILFKIMPDGTHYSKLLDFTGIINGSNPLGSLIFDSNFFYGMTSQGGSVNAGTIFKIHADGMAVKENNPKTYFTIYPNPLSEWTTLRTESHLTNASLTVYNLVGQIVTHIDHLTGQTIVFHRDNLPSGLYFVQLTEEEKTYTNKLLIIDK